VEESIDIPAVLRVAGQAEPAQTIASGIFPRSPVEPTTTIAVAQDEAFCFYYQDNLDLISAWGGRLAPFSPLHDRSLPEGIQGIYLGGGFPELFAAELAANRTMIDSIRAAHTAGMPIYAECGGLMYLCESVTDPEGQLYIMGGLVPAHAAMRGRKLTLGYAEVRARRDSLLLKEGQIARGHEFHWSGVEPALNGPEAPYEVVDEGRAEGYQRGNLLASYVHLHFASLATLAPNFVASCGRWGAGR